MNLPDINKVLFMDIETVPQYKTFAEAPEILRHLFVQKFKNKKSSQNDLKKVKSKKSKEAAQTSNSVLKKENDLAFLLENLKKRFFDKLRMTIIRQFE